MLQNVKQIKIINVSLNKGLCLFGDCHLFSQPRFNSRSTRFRRFFTWYGWAWCFSKYLEWYKIQC